MIEFDEQFLIDNQLSFIKDSEYKNLLIWAHCKKYIQLRKSPSGLFCFSQEDLNKAKMWAEKEGKNEII